MAGRAPDAGLRVLTTLAAWGRARLRPCLREKLGLTLGLTTLFAVCWVLIPRYLAGAAHTLPLTALERRLPFVESFVYVYLSICLFMPLAPYLTASRPLLRRHAGGFVALTLVSGLAFVLYPVEVPPPPEPARTFLLQLLLQDTRLNSFPSLHAGYTVYSLLYWAEILPDVPAGGARRALAGVLTAWAALILTSVLLTKRHYLLDVAAGAALGAACYGLTFHRLPGARRAPLRLITPTRETPR